MKVPSFRSMQVIAWLLFFAAVAAIIIVFPGDAPPSGDPKVTGRP